MAKFDDVHRKAMPERALRRGEPWRIALREPLDFTPVESGIAPDVPVKIVTFTVNDRNRLAPASEEDRALLADWQRRHLATPLDRFDAPEWFAFPTPD